MVTEKDLPWLGGLLYRECEKVRSGGLTVDWSPLEAHEFLGRIWGRPDYHIEVIRKNGIITAVCGAALIHTLLPPHPLTCVEWLWWGVNKKDTVRVWQACLKWGKAQGAEYAHYEVNPPQTNPQKFITTNHWLRL